MLTVAQIAGINAAKQTHNLIPLCHQLMLRKVAVDLALNPDARAVDITVRDKSPARDAIPTPATA